MIDKNLCYLKLCGSSVIQRYFQENKSELSFQPYYGFDVSTIPLDLALQEPLLASLHRKHQIMGAGIIRIDKDRCYKWHCDAVRGATINMLLSESNSMVLFGNMSKDSEDQYEVIRLDYEVGSFYAFNTQAMHTVINFDEPRYLFTIEFCEDKRQLSYNNLIESLSELQSTLPRVE
jgi:hypothetical protein